jgi:hypothetical protein
MNSQPVPYIAVQIFSHAIPIRLEDASAGEYFKRLKRRLRHMSIRKTKETKKQVIFTARYRRQTITVVISSVPVEKNVLIRSGVLYSNFDCAHLNWVYLNETR